MTPQSRLIEAIVNDVNAALSAEIGPVTIGQTPPGGGVTAEVAPGFPVESHFDRGSLQILPLLFLSKGKDQQKAVDALFAVCNFLTQKAAYPSGDGWQATGVSVATSPNYVDREQSGGAFIFAAVLNVEFYMKGVNYA